MARNGREGVTIEQVRDAAAKAVLLNKKGDIEDVSAQDIADVLRRGSDGYIGAHLQTVKREVLMARYYDTIALSAQFKAALVDETNRITDSTKEYVLKDSGMTQALFDEICTLNAGLNEELADLKEKHQRLSQGHDVALTAHKDGMAAAAVEIERLTARCTDAEQAKLEAVGRLNEVQTGLGVMTERAKNLDATLGEKEAEAKELRHLLRTAEEGRTKAGDRANRAEALNQSLQWRVESLDGDKSDLQNRLEAAIERAAKAEAELEQLRERTPGNQGGNGPKQRQQK